jgi:hypothetical protein
MNTKNLIGSFEEYNRQLHYFANKRLDEQFAQYNPEFFFKHCGEGITLYSSVTLPDEVVAHAREFTAGIFAGAKFGKET